MLKPPRELTTEQESCLKLADFIEYGPWKFHMAQPSPRPECGSAGCILGHARMLWGSSTFTGEFGRRIGANLSEVQYLCFHPRSELGKMVRYEDITKSAAAAVLRRFALYKQTHFEVE